MKKDPSQIQAPDIDSNSGTEDGHGPGSVMDWMEDSLLDNVDQVHAEVIEIKQEFPSTISPFLELELEGGVETGSGELERINPNQQYPMASVYENDDEDNGGDATSLEAKIDKMAAAIIKEEAEVKDVKPVLIPIPLTLPDKEASKSEIVIDYHTRRKPKMQLKKPRPCICTICHTGFPSQQLFQLHMSNAHSDKRPHHCSHCGKGFATAVQRDVHETIHDPNRFKGEPKHGCDLCDKKYHIKGSMEGHRRKAHFGYKPPLLSKVVTEHHSVGVRNSQPPKKEVKVFQCPYCDLKFAMRCEMKSHMRCHIRTKPYQCQQCNQRFTWQGSLNNHMRNRHLNPSSKPRPFRPSFMYRQPCPCTVCGKVFKVPCQLQRHSLLHTGEKPHECGECGQRFRLRDVLMAHRLRKHERPQRGVNEYEAFKCRICGKDGMVMFTSLQSHRLMVHRHIPFDSENEKPYGCGICGKPYYRKGQAIVCALLRHDPATLIAVMFKHKCPACPEERFGYHSTLALRRHWETEHLDKPLPVHYRAHSGMYKERDNQEDTLPTVRVNKELAKRIQANGPLVKSEFPLYTEFGLLPVEHKFYKDLKKSTRRKRAAGKPPQEKRPWTCHI